MPSVLLEPANDGGHADHPGPVTVAASACAVAGGPGFSERSASGAAVCRSLEELSMYRLNDIATQFAAATATAKVQVPGHCRREDDLNLIIGSFRQAESDLSGPFLLGRDEQRVESTVLVQG